MQLNLIEEDHLTGLWMLDDCRAKLLNTQTVVVLPLEVDRSLAAVLFYFRSLISLEEVLPTDVQPIGEVANVHQSLLLESIAHARIHLFIDLPAIDDWRLA